MELEGQHFDIVIVGGGLAGNCLALALKDTGMKIAIIEANTREFLLKSDMGDRALALAAGTVRTLDKLGIWQSIQSKATAIKDIHVSDKGHFGKVRLSAKKQNVDALGYVITARAIESHLVQEVEKTSVTVVSPARVVGLASDENSVHISLKYHDESSCITAQLLVGADGGNSTIRKLLDISQEITEYGQTALVTTVKTTLHHNNIAYERFTDSGPLALLPAGKKECAVVWTRRNDDAAALMADNEIDFLDQLQLCFGYRLGRLSLSAPRRAFPVSLIKAGKMQSGRAIIIGNAVHQLHPVAGQGFNLGLRDVVQLADMLIKRHGQNKDLGSPDFLHTYVMARETDHRKTISFTDSLVRLFSNDNLALAAARNIGLAIFDHIPAAKYFLSKHAMGLAQKIPDLDSQQQ